MGISLVTGGAGFIGSHLVEELVNEGLSVRVLDDFSSGTWENLDNVLGSAEVIAGSINNAEVVCEAMRGVDCVYHLAALSSVPKSMEEPEKTFLTNNQGTLTVMKAAASSGVTSFINVSTAAVYGASPTLPKKESMKTAPISPYALSKRYNEEMGEMFFRVFGLPVISLRFFNVYGPKQRPDSDYAAVIPKFISAMSRSLQPIIFGDGTQERDFIYVRDVTRAVYLASQHPEAAGKIFNVAAGKSYSLLQLVETINSALGTELTPLFEEERAGDIKKSSADVSQAEKLLGFKSEVSFEDGIKQTAAQMSTNYGASFNRDLNCA